MQPKVRRIAAYAVAVGLMVTGVATLARGVLLLAGIGLLLLQFFPEAPTPLVLSSLGLSGSGPALLVASLWLWRASRKPGRRKMALRWMAAVLLALGLAGVVWWLVLDGEKVSSESWGDYLAIRLFLPGLAALPAGAWLFTELRARTEASPRELK
jgi:hypothetical protein